MKNKIIYLFLTALLSFNLFSNENTLRPGSGVYEFHFFNVTNPAGFVAAIETFDSSSCAEKWRNESLKRQCSTFARYTLRHDSAKRMDADL